ncbi:MAG: hypothetical protein ABIQ16_11450 [Polyangiaceae bacterium]
MLKKPRHSLSRRIQAAATLMSGGAARLNGPPTNILLWCFVRATIERDEFFERGWRPRLVKHAVAAVQYAVKRLANSRHFATLVE